jgi:hypothetical protein
MFAIADTVVPVDSVESYVNILKSPEAGADVVVSEDAEQPDEVVAEVIAVLTRVIQAQQQQIQALEARVNGGN